jgi:CheY-like chemotaxis protein
VTDELTVLIAEDDDGHATLVRRNLKRAGLRSDPVHLRDGQDALDYVFRRGAWSGRRTHGPLAMILDLNMPRLGGVQVLEQLKTDRDRGRVPVFVLTTTDNPAEINRCYSLGASACLVKPVDYGQLSDMVQRLAHFLMSARLPSEESAVDD